MAAVLLQGPAASLDAHGLVGFPQLAAAVELAAVAEPGAFRLQRCVAGVTDPVEQGAIAAGAALHGGAVESRALTMEQAKPHR
jgi:hypothetical protein